MALVDTLQSKALEKFFAAQEKKKANTFQVSFSELEKIFDQKLPSVAKSAGAGELHWNNKSRISEQWMLCGFVISQYDHANAIIHFEHSEEAKATAEARIKLRLDEERQRKLEAEEILKAIPDPSGATYFRNEANGHVEKVELAGFLTLLIGPFYFAIKGIWGHALFSLLAALITFGLSWLIYPFAATTITRNHFLHRGWTPISENEAGVSGGRKNGAFTIYSKEDYLWVSLIIGPLICLFSGLIPIAFLWFGIQWFFMRRAGYFGKKKEEE